MVSAVSEQGSGPRYEGLRLSREEYLDLPEDGYRYDMIGGVLHVTPSSSFEHGSLLVQFGHLLAQYLRSKPSGRAVTEVDVLLPDGGDVLRPDVCFLSTENLHLVKTHIHGAPDLVCEVLSAGTRARDLGVKAQRYLACGVKEYWVVDPEPRSVEVWINDGNAWTKRCGDPVESALLDGLLIRTSDLFLDL